MSNINDRLIHTITNPGCGFTLGAKIKNKTFPPDSEGFISYILGPDYNNPNIVFHKVVTTRRGKKGKIRIDTDILLSPIFTVPGVDMNDIISSDKIDERNFTDLLITPVVTYNMQNQKSMKNLTFIANILSKGLFIKELDKASFKPNTKIMQDIGIHNKKQVSVWPKNKNSLLRKLVEEASQLFNMGETETLVNLFCSNKAKNEIVAELRLLESYLVIPKFEYQRKVYEVLVKALTYIHDNISKKSDKTLKNRKEILDMIKDSKRRMQAHILSTVEELNCRLGIILKNRKIIEF